jgi:hypothetical protein
VQRNPADQLHVVMALPEGSLAGFTHSSESLRQQIVQCLALRQAQAKFVGFNAQRLIVQRLELLLEAVYLCDYLARFFDLAFVGVAPHDAYDPVEHILIFTCLPISQSTFLPIYLFPFLPGNFRTFFFPIYPGDYSIIEVAPLTPSPSSVIITPGWGVPGDGIGSGHSGPP